MTFRRLLLPLLATLALGACTHAAKPVPPPIVAAPPPVPP
jgi:NTE family protein